MAEMQNDQNKDNATPKRVIARILFNDITFMAVLAAMLIWQQYQMMDFQAGMADCDQLETRKIAIKVDKIDIDIVTLQTRIDTLRSELFAHDVGVNVKRLEFKDIDENRDEISRVSEKSLGTLDKLMKNCEAGDRFNVEGNLLIACITLMMTFVGIKIGMRQAAS
ncbi:hypothetical protein N5J77_04470 [Sphingobium yanoikuyae]|uniref:Uncharacterized protein n=1 Tax=Sphingobium yanoikuyae TaxID=13690 RepID=A0AA42WRC0_SPHYA|nr:hypothetical protein [Sphingobium yanoikuyae]MDH2130370.1 hypothetical protein [Sphingobium yanoikuyae]MDH2148288.1 hypothetical protein [Sphingobium yanoikuyae]MDH2165887.1 hypothetical protein [Sphingobium yanoikuyae]